MELFSNAPEVLGEINPDMIVGLYGERDGKPGFYRSIQFAASFRDKVPLEKANQWNRECRYVKVYADTDCELAFEQDIALDGGVTRQFLPERLTDWRRMFPTVLSFVSQEHLDGAPARARSSRIRRRRVEAGAVEIRAPAARSDLWMSVLEATGQPIR